MDVVALDVIISLGRRYITCIYVVTVALVKMGPKTMKSQNHMLHVRSNRATL